jgi:anaphase-promoting complex subunit 2
MKPGRLSPSEYNASVSYSHPSCYSCKKHRLGHTILSAYTLNFQTHLFSILPPIFARGFKALCASTLSDAEPPTAIHPTIWNAFDTLGLVDRYESLIASVGYEHIEAHVLEVCAGRWTEPMLNGLRDWMSDKIVPWMLLPYARGASTSEYTCVLLSLTS